MLTQEAILNPNGNLLVESSMSAKHYELADALRKAAKDISSGGSAAHPIDIVIARIERVLQDDNPRFDPIRFRTACRG